MKIGVFVVTAGRHGGGPETYEVQLLRALARIDKSNEYFIYCTTQKSPEAIGINQANFTYRVLKPASRWVSIPITLPFLMILDGIDFYHATMVPPPWSPKPFLMTILCSSNWVHPEFYPKAVVWRLNKLLERSLHKARTLLPISKDLLGDVEEMWGVPTDRMRVTYMGVGEEFSPREEVAARALLAERYGITGRYLLFIGQQQERKNVFRVIEAYANYRMRFTPQEKSDLPKLLIVGRENDATDAIAEAIRKCGIEEHVTRLRYVPFADAPELYSVADALLFPSLWEGFGLPLVESMACGTPVITSTATCLPEVAGDAAIIVDPESVSALADAIYDVQTRPALRQSLIAKGFERARMFTWENCARTTLEAYGAMLAPARSVPSSASARSEV
jgi:glycosyltransferase involved in cell wall biosynthesis